MADTAGEPSTPDHPGAVAAWLRSSGLPLEARVWAAFKTADPTAEHARTYVDAAEGVVREVDVVATRWGPWPGNSGTASILRAVVECKASPSVSWVALVDERRKVPGIHHGAKAFFDLVDLATLRGAQREQFTRMYDVPLFDHFGGTAYHLLNTGAKGSEAGDKRNRPRNETFDALRQVMSAVKGLHDDREDVHGPLLVITIPVLVTSSPLFECRVKADGELDVTATDETLLVTRLVPGDAMQAVWVVQERGVAAFVQRFIESADNLRAI